MKIVWYEKGNGQGDNNNALFHAYVLYCDAFKHLLSRVISLKHVHWYWYWYEFWICHIVQFVSFCVLSFSFSLTRWSSTRLTSSLLLTGCSVCISIQFWVIYCDQHMRKQHNMHTQPSTTSHYSRSQCKCGCACECIGGQTNVSSYYVHILLNIS